MTGSLTLKLGGGEALPAPVTGAITALKLQKKNRDRVSLFIDGRFAFGLPAIVAAKLKIGQILSDDDIEALQAL